LTRLHGRWRSGFTGNRTGGARVGRGGDRAGAALRAGGSSLALKPKGLDPWLALCLVALVAIVLMMIGFGGVYTRIAGNGGAPALIGFLAIELAYFFQGAKVSWELCIYPGWRATPGRRASSSTAR
jgi:hypothetical protein